MAKQPKKKRRLVKGKDWDRWAVKLSDGSFGGTAEFQRYLFPHAKKYRIVKVNLVEVK